MRHRIQLVKTDGLKGEAAMTDLSALIDTDRHRLTDAAWLGEKRNELNAQGVVQMRGLLQPDALADLQNESAIGLNQAYFRPQSHNI